MFNDEDDDTPVEVDPELDTELADAESGDEDDEADVMVAARKPRHAGAKKAAAKAKAQKPAKAAKKLAPAKAAAKSPKKAAKAAKKSAATKKAKAPAPPPDLTGVKAGAHTLWVSKDLAGALTSKDRRKLKALLKRAEKRRKTQKK